MRFAAFLVVATALAFGCMRRPPPPPPGEVLVVRATEPRDGRPGAVVFAEVVWTYEDRRRGLSGREELAPDAGMLFVYPRDEPREFWMKDTHIALDIAFIRDDGAIAALETLPAGTEARHDRIPRAQSREPVRYVLETNAGWFASHGIGVGDRVNLVEATRGVEAE